MGNLITKIRSLRVCLFGSEIGWMENFGKKIGRETFFRLCLVGWEGRKTNGRTQVFSLQTYQKISPQFFRKYNVLLFVLFNRDMMVNLYKIYFEPN